MLLLEPIFYYEQILKQRPNSYIAEDSAQVIIGIDCEYIDGDGLDFCELEAYFNECKFHPKNSAAFGGLFGVMGYEIVHKFEQIGQIKESKYHFPTFFYANASSYLHYDKVSKIYTYYGDDLEYYAKLQELKFSQKDENSELFYEIKNDLNEEKKHFLDMVSQAKNYIKQGDIFQVVVSEILEISSNLTSLKFYEKLKINNPSPYMFHFPTPYGDVVGSSPELIMQIKNSEIFVAPIAGTRRRGASANEDEALKNELLGDEKELAEHKMLIDLARNDIGKFAKTGSVSVRNPIHIVMYESVMHIASEVYGKKPHDVSAFDIFSVIFPAGTLSGSPKIRAMQIINELEKSARGIYGGGIGFWHFNGDVQIAILIRSAIFVAQKDSANSIFIGAGAGIVYDSDALSEYDEICKKRQSCTKVIEELCKERV